MKIGIIGYGFVGKALEKGFLENVDIFIVDPILNTTISELASFKPEYVFICVPTPVKKDGSQDLHILDSVFDEVNKILPKCIIVIKSTVLPDALKSYSLLHKHVVFNPEFLRERSAVDDFINSKLIVFGGKEEDCLKLDALYKNNTKCIHKEYVHTDIITASMVKYAINSFLSTKVTFFNQLNEVFAKSGSSGDWSNLISTIALDNRIGLSHMDVPGPDKRKGFGGACLPKDTQALIEYADSLDLRFSLLESVMDINNKIRNQYLDVLDRETDQNISFKKDI